MDDVTATPPQHVVAQQSFEDTLIAPINGTTNYSANLTGGIAPDQCATVPPDSSYPAVSGQVCIDYAGGFKYDADSTDHWQRTAQTYANF